MIETLKSRHKEALLLTGLGDDEVVNRQVDFVNWLNKRRPSDAQIHVFNTLWQTNEAYKDKKRRLLNFLAEHAGVEVVYAVSAGASLGMSLVPELPKSTEYHFISGKLLYPESIGLERDTRAPALYDSVVASEEIIASYDLNQYKMTCHAGYLDGILEQKDMRIPGIPFERIHMVNHSATIVLAYATILRRL